MRSARAGGMIMALAQADGLIRRKSFCAIGRPGEVVEISAIAADAERFSHPPTPGFQDICVYLLAGEGQERV
jgi:hypothetical protein